MTSINLAMFGRNLVILSYRGLEILQIQETLQLKVLREDSLNKFYVTEVNIIIFEYLLVFTGCYLFINVS